MEKDFINAYENRVIVGTHIEHRYFFVSEVNRERKKTETSDEITADLNGQRMPPTRFFFRPSEAF